jgi:hypothetical protein
MPAVHFDAFQPFSQRGGDRLGSLYAVESLGGMNVDNVLELYPYQND